MTNLLDRLNARSFALCGGHYEPKSAQDAENGALMLEAMNRVSELEAENARLRKDAERLDWLADPDNWLGNVDLPTQCVMANLDSLRCAIDMAMKLPKFDTSSERVEKSAESMHDCDGAHHHEQALNMVDWPEDDRRIDQIGREGNEGLIYGERNDRS